MAILQSFVTDSTGVISYFVSIALGGLLVWGLLELFPLGSTNTVNYSAFELSYSKAKKRFLANAKQLIASGFEKSQGRPFGIIGDSGPTVMFPPTAIDAVNGEPALDFLERQKADFFGGLIPGFEPFDQPPDHLIPNTVRIKVTQNLGKMLGPLSREMQDVLHERWSEQTEWHTRNLRQDLLRIVARLSARVFVGPDLYHDEKWLDVAIDFAAHAITASQELRMWPAVLRPFVHWFLPKCRRLRCTVAEAEKLVLPVVEKRRAMRAAGTRLTDETEDAIDWLDEMSKGKISFNPAYAQLGLALASIHTTTDLLSQALINLSLYPEAVEPLRQEAKTVIEQHGLSKVTMHQLQLLDSFLKETQRMKPPSITTIDRKAVAKVKLDDGTVIPKGAKISISQHDMWSPTVHHDPDVFHPRRFLEWRNTPGKEHKSHLVSTSPQHTAFGHGKHACPGRFFAANEMKIAILHILLKYDVALADGGGATPTPSGVPVGSMLMADPQVMVRVRRRQDEVVL